MPRPFSLKPHLREYVLRHQDCAEGHDLFEDRVATGRDVGTRCTPTTLVTLELERTLRVLLEELRGKTGDSG